MLYAWGHQGPTFKHDTEEAARAEAEKLAKQLRVPVYLLEATAKCEAGDVQADNKRMNKAFTVELDRSYMAIIHAPSEAIARQRAISDLAGRYGRNWRQFVDITWIAETTPEDKAWLKMMGGVEI